MRGVELLRATGLAASASSRWRPSPVMAALAALLPGLGAVYNRQNTKAFVHFLLVCGLLELAELTGLSLLAMGGGFFYVYSMIDAYRTAQAIGQGLDPAQDDERLRQFLQENVRTWAGILIGLGLLFLLTDVFHLLTLPRSVFRLWPLLLIGLAAYLLYRQGRAGRSQAIEGSRSPDFRLVTPTLFSPPAEQHPDRAGGEGQTSWPHYPPRGSRGVTSEPSWRKPR